MHIISLKSKSQHILKELASVTLLFFSDRFWILRLKEWAFYLKNDKERAAHYFSQGRDFMNLGCVLAEMGCFLRP